jgi:hypothetical protein
VSYFDLSSRFENLHFNSANSHNELIKKWDTGRGYRGRFKKLYVPRWDSEMKNKDKDTYRMEKGIDREE